MVSRPIVIRSLWIILYRLGSPPLIITTSRSPFRYSRLRWVTRVWGMVVCTVELTHLRVPPSYQPVSLNRSPEKTIVPFTSTLNYLSHNNSNTYLDPSNPKTTTSSNEIGERLAHFLHIRLKVPLRHIRVPRLRV